MAAAATSSSTSASPLLLPSGPRRASASRAWIRRGGGASRSRALSSEAPFCCKAAAAGSAAQCGEAYDFGCRRRRSPSSATPPAKASSKIIRPAVQGHQSGRRAKPTRWFPGCCKLCCHGTIQLKYVAHVITKFSKIFDSSLEKGQPYIFRVGSGQVIQGLDEGILSMKVGGLRRLYIPGPLAFPKGLTSASGRPRVPPSSPVVFDVNLLYIPGLDDE
ncbi:unnamed protein product [Urochloa decumbens]|uniref:peptidylprolyl isomerase n=1 Tax=Urochloa decumbens TaxID=240449 RepID=A0ABC8XCE4_9POAL